MLSIPEKINYSASVPEKKGNRIAVLKPQGAKPSTIDGFFFAQHIGFAPMEGRVRESQDSLVTCGQYCNLARSSTPIAVGAVDFSNQSQGAHHG
jgi:hypothetical protein